TPNVGNNVGLGIGTSTPAWALQVSSSTRPQFALSDASLTNDIFTIRRVGNFTYFGTSSPSTFATSTVPNITIDNNGNVGIGTSSPYARLAVNGDIAGATVNAYSTTSTSTLAGGFVANGGSVTSDWSTGVTSIDNLNLGAMTFDTNAGKVSWVDMPVTSAAAAGVVESYTAQINGNPLLTIFSESDGAGSIRNPRVSVGTTTPYSTFSVFGNSSDAVLANFVSNASSSLFTILNSGNVGVGTVAPNFKFEVQGTASTTNLYASYGTTTNSTSTNLFTTTASSTNLFVSTGTCTGSNALNVVSGKVTCGVISGGTAASSTLLADNNSFSGANSFATLLVTGSSTLQNFTAINSTTTNATSTNFFATTASSTNFFATNSNLGAVTAGLINGQTVSSAANFTGTLTATGGLTTLSNLLATGSSTLQNFTFVNATGTSATTTSLFSTTASTTNLFSTLFNTGNITATGLVTASNILAIGSTTLQNFTFINATGTRATTTNLFSTTASSTNLFSTNGNVGFFQFGNATGTSATTTNLFSTTASSTNLFSTNGNIGILNFGNATGTTLFATTASTTNLFSTNGNIANLTLTSAIGGSTRCAQFTTAGLLQANASACGSGGAASTEKWATSTGAFLSITPNVGNNVGLGIGTSTPAWALQVSSSTRPQLALSDGSLTSNIWTFRNAGGNLYLATSSPSTFATSTYTALSLDGTTGNIGVGTTTPWGKLSVEMNGTNPSFVVGRNGSSTPSLYVGGVNENGFVGFGTTTNLNSLARITMDSTLNQSGSTYAIGGMFQNFNFNPTVNNTVQVGNRLVINNSPTATNTAVGQIIRVVDNSGIS
ncbi:MAG: hypothetical protein ABIP06_04060, partial [Pyrinomonadaceae bacterium]